jgi:cysteinyl-tRNA synthetase
MSRSAGTAVTLRDLLSRGHTGSRVRRCLLGVHYRKHMEFNDETLDAACRELARRPRGRGLRAGRRAEG